MLFHTQNIMRNKYKVKENRNSRIDNNVSDKRQWIDKP